MFCYKWRGEILPLFILYLFFPPTKVFTSTLLQFYKPGFYLPYPLCI